MLKKKIGYIIIGTVMGSILTMSTGALAQSSKLISAYLGNHIRFEFNGEEKKPPQDKPAIIYKDSVYVPIRFIAEGSNMPINWNAQTQKVEIKTPEPEVIEKIIYKEMPKEDDDKEIEDVKEVEEKDTRIYQTYPILKTYIDMDVTVQTVLKSDNETKIFVAIKNKEFTPLQLIQSETIIEVDGTTYNISDITSARWDESWYHDVRKDQIKEGFIIFKNIPEDSKGIHLVLKVLKNDGSGKYAEVPFDIKLN